MELEMRVLHSINVLKEQGAKDHIEIKSTVTILSVNGTSTDGVLAATE